MSCSPDTTAKNEIPKNVTNFITNQIVCYSPDAITKNKYEYLTKTCRGNCFRIFMNFLTQSVFLTIFFKSSNKTCQIKDLWKFVKTKFDFRCHISWTFCYNQKYFWTKSNVGFHVIFWSVGQIFIFGTRLVKDDKVKENVHMYFYSLSWSK